MSYGAYGASFQGQGPAAYQQGGQQGQAYGNYGYGGGYGQQGSYGPAFSGPAYGAPQGQPQQQLTRWAPPDTSALRVGKHGTYVALINNTYQVTGAGILKAETLHDEKEAPRIVADTEEDIGNRLGAVTQGATQTSVGAPIYNVRLGLAYPNDEHSTLFVFHDVVLDYRTNIGVPNLRKTNASGRPQSYMDTYANTGMKFESFKWIHDTATRDLNATVKMPNDYQKMCKEDRIWFNSNIDANRYPEFHDLNDDGTITVHKSQEDNLKHKLRGTCQSLKGVVAFEIKMHRERTKGNFYSDGARPVFQLTFALRFMIPQEATSETGPGLSPVTGVVLKLGDLKVSQNLKKTFNQAAAYADPGVRGYPGQAGNEQAFTPGLLTAQAQQMSSSVVGIPQPQQQMYGGFSGGFAAAPQQQQQSHMPHGSGGPPAIPPAVPPPSGPRK